MKRIDGKRIAQEVLAEVSREVADAVPRAGGTAPGIALVRVGEDPASISYIRGKGRKAEQAGIRSTVHILPDTASVAELDALLDRLNADPQVHGILVQSPLPPQFDETRTFNRVDPAKDVDGFGATNLGLLVQGAGDPLTACTPTGIVEILRRCGVETAGKQVVVVGRSLIVGKPLSLLLSRKGPGGDATVTLCHSRTRDLATVCRTADILVAAIGRAGFITAEMVRPGAVVIDVGINRVIDRTRKRGYRIVGDVDFDAVAEKASLITPVPGGVGPLTIACLLRNTVKAWKRSVGIA